MAQARYKRILLKLSGEAFKGGKADTDIDAVVVSDVAHRIKQALDMHVQIAIVVGAGNIWRGATAEKAGFDRVTADYAGMLATVINALALQDTLEKIGVETRVQSALNIQQVSEPFIRRRAIRHMEKGRVVILASGTGNPYMTTDTAAALRAIELGAEVLLMTKNCVDGVYDSDPRKNPLAKKFDHLTYMQALNMRLNVMDTTALSLCMDNKLPIIVFNLQAEHSMESAIGGKYIGTLINNEEDL
ncbi:MAG: UMP kinase [Dehalococcoidia bacterium]|nr:UMP kinase [Dehalococcoidia bacterium]